MNLVKSPIYLFIIYFKLSEKNKHRIEKINTYDNMAEHWTLQDTSIITDATQKQRTQLINNL